MGGRAGLITGLVCHPRRSLRFACLPSVLPDPAPSTARRALSRPASPDLAGLTSDATTHAAPLHP